MWECETQRVNGTAAAPLASSEEVKDLKGNAVVFFPRPLLARWSHGTGGSRLALMWVWICGIKGG